MRYSNTVAMENRIQTQLGDFTQAEEKWSHERERGYLWARRCELVEEALQILKTGRAN